jgi:hypothetical protein
MMIGYSGRVSAKNGARFRGGAMALIYALLSLNLPVLFESASRSSRPGASAVAAQAIAAPGSVATAAAAESGHACCCRHSGNACERGCCASKQRSVPGGSCYRNCAGHDAHQGAVPTAYESHLAAASGSMPGSPGFADPLPTPEGARTSPLPEPPEKIPIV